MLTQLSLRDNVAAAAGSVASWRLKCLSAIGVIIMLTGCAHQPTPSSGPSRPVVRVQPPDWFHQQVAAARAAKQAHQPKTDTAGAQAAYDSVLRTACTRAAVAEPGRYPARCDAVLHPLPSQPAIGACEADPDDPVAVIECND